jgi:hypothetical protein
VSSDWRELDFFRAHYGLSKRTDQLEAAICYDFELPRECRPLIDHILSIPDRVELARSYLEGVPYYARWAPNYSEHPELEPIIPLVCLLASWFPAPWLAGAKKERQRIVNLLAKSYAHERPLVLRPYSEAYLKMLTRTVQVDRQKKKKPRAYSIYLVAIDANEPFATTAQ